MMVLTFCEWKIGATIPSTCLFMQLILLYINCIFKMNVEAMSALLLNSCHGAVLFLYSHDLYLYNSSGFKSFVQLL